MFESSIPLEKFNIFQDYVKKHNLIEKNDHILAAISGGIDSVALAHLLFEIKNKIGFKLSLMHVNHGFRGEESDGDEFFCKRLAGKLNVDFYSIKLKNEDFENLDGSKQEKARILRLQILKAKAKEISANKIATGHNLNDNVETILFRLLRGTSIKGLLGISPKSKEIIRPMLSLSREDIESLNFEYREDSTNKETNYTRNKIRHNLVPVLKEINDHAVENIVRTSENLKGDFEILQKTENEYLTNCLELTSYGSIINVKNLKEKGVTKEIFSNILYREIMKYVSDRQDIESKHIEIATNKILTTHSFFMDLPQNICLWLSLGELLVTSKENSKILSQDWEFKLVPGINIIKLPFLSIEIYANESDVLARSWKNGDKLASKNLKIFFNKKRIPEFKRKITPIIITKNNEIRLEKL